MTNQEYKAIAAVTHSDLMAFKKILFCDNLDHVPSEKAYKLGNLVHTALLNPQSLSPSDYQDFDEKQLMQFETSISRARQEHAWLLKWITKQQVCIWTDPSTNFTCKARIDGNLRKNTIVEIKTTYASNLPAFLKTLDQYGYDQQAAWYKDGFDAVHGTDIKFLFMIISKIPPYRVMLYQPSNELLARGRKIYKALIDGIKRGGFTPEEGD